LSENFAGAQTEIVFNIFDPVVGELVFRYMYGLLPPSAEDNGSVRYCIIGNNINTTDATDVSYTTFWMIKQYCDLCFPFNYLSFFVTDFPLFQICEIDVRDDDYGGMLFYITAHVTMNHIQLHTYLVYHQKEPKSFNI
jgi:hypothetical protein